LVLSLVIAPAFEELESLGSRGGLPPNLTVFFSIRPTKIIFLESLKIDRLIPIVLETENFID